VTQEGMTAACSYSIAPTDHAVPVAGVTRTVAVTAPSGCTWTVASQAGWIVVTSGANGSGNGAVNLSVSTNTGGLRVGTVTIADQTYTVTQAGCAYSLSVTSQSVPAGGGTGTVGVTAPSDCTWTATSQAAWIVVTSGANGSGSGAVNLSVPANTGVPRVGTVKIAGQTYTVTQAACTYSLSPKNQSVPTSGGNFSVLVNTQTGCPWTPTSNATWITVGNSGTGTGTMSYTVDAGPDKISRIGTITISGQTLTVKQAEKD
jgi:hypothetical protein